MLETILLGACVLGTIVVLANAAEKRPKVRPLLYGLLLGSNFYLCAAVLQVRENAALLALNLSLVGAATALLVPAVRQRLAQWLPKDGFKPESPLHMTALIFCLYLVVNSLLTFAQAGDLSTLSQNIQTEGDVLSLEALFAQMLIFVAFALLGVGFGTRRSLGEAFQRLALRAPTLRELYAGIGVAFVLFWMVYGLTVLWQLLLPPQVVEQQTEVSGLIASNISTLGMAFWLAFTAAVGEEIAFRGALQPIFGVWLTSAVFALTHVQYAFTPALGIIFIVSLGFSWARQRYNTTVAIVAHFSYNFAFAAMVVFARYALDVLEMMP